MADCFIKLDEVAGESGDADFKDHLQVESWGWGIAQHVSAGWERQAKGVAAVSELIFTHRVDSASPALFALCARNYVIPSATLVMRRAGGAAQKYLYVRLKKVRVINVQLLHDAANLVPQERVTLAYQQVDYEYVPQSAVGADRSGKSVFSYQTNNPAQ